MCFIFELLAMEVTLLFVLTITEVISLDSRRFRCTNGRKQNTGTTSCVSYRIGRITISSEKAGCGQTEVKGDLAHAGDLDELTLAQKCKEDRKGSGSPLGSASSLSRGAIRSDRRSRTCG